MSHMSFEHPYFGAFVMLILSFGVFWLISKLSSIVGSKFANQNDDKLKSAIYESGPEANKQPNRINSHFYLVAVLFILFDVEIIFMFPWAVNFRYLGVFGFVEMVLFILLLTIGFIYAWHKGALEWHSIK
ncbi:NAD(P)H-quinone oxidoreductase subunit 3 [Campylobacter sp. FMV-PI01]|uniref:NADH-quinone oxidoreductase subunit A n=1 Tax=Campylobacter portucalensis TaxID=2608384 RepID=A0A6L5WIS3_9BACT|nr:NAD(P)H-quinone oxidoreductase subunit 3 [Campylobacter portucalensis]MSN95723.1 NAD(P)H-quinone oxidoreductase subunit 3 [Campylobacter portucalensis]